LDDIFDLSAFQLTRWDDFSFFFIRLQVFWGIWVSFR
jgi:hypothetical protein